MSLHPGVQIGTGNCNAGGNPVMGDGLASHPGGGGGGGEEILSGPSAIWLVCRPHLHLQKRTRCTVMGQTMISDFLE